MITDVAGRRAQDLLDSASRLRCKGTAIRGRAVSFCPTLEATSRFLPVFSPDGRTGGRGSGAGR